MLDRGRRTDWTRYSTRKPVDSRGSRVASVRFWCWCQMGAVPRKSPRGSGSHSKLRLATGAVSWQNSAFITASASCESQSERDWLNRERIHEGVRHLLAVVGHYNCKSEPIGTKGVARRRIRAVARAETFQQREKPLKKFK